MKFSTSLFFSFLIHAFLFCLLGVFFSRISFVRNLPQLDLSSIELSLSQTPKEDAAQPAFESLNETPMNREVPVPPEAVKPLTEKSGILMSAVPAVEDKLRIEDPLPERPNMVEPEYASSSQPTPLRARVFAPPSAKKAIVPHYPVGSRRRGETGDVVVSFVVLPSGKATDVSVVNSSGFKDLDEAAVLAVLKANFNPAKDGEKEVSSPARIKLSFQLK